MYLMLK